MDAVTRKFINVKNVVKNFMDMSLSIRHSALRTVFITIEEAMLMILSNVEKYMTSLAPINTLFNEGIITAEEYKKAEQILADKYCIKPEDIHRPNDLIISGFRVIYMHENKEANNGKENSSNRRVTTIEKKT